MIAQHFEGVDVLCESALTEYSEIRTKFDAYKVLGGKSEHQTAACRAERAGAVFASEPRRKVSQKIHSQSDASAFVRQRWNGEV